MLCTRWSDFLVSEVGLDGTVARLELPQRPPAAVAAPVVAPTEPPVPPAAPGATPGPREGDKAGAAQEAAAWEEPHGPCGDQSVAAAAFATLLSEADVGAWREWVAACAAVWTRRGAELPPPLLLSPTADRAARAAVHALVRRHMHWVESDTAGSHDEPEKSVRLSAKASGRLKRPAPAGQSDIAAGHHTKRGVGRRVDAHDGNGQAAGQARDVMPADKQVLSFVLCKENTDTHAALAVLASMLGVPSKALSFAGTKDKRGVTCQRVTLARCTGPRLLGINSRLIAMRVGTPTYVASHLGLGDLRGNQFCVTLRDVQCPGGPDGVHAALRELRTHGFINYFGLQRFGASPEARTHATGAALLRGEWDAAVQLIMAPRSGDRQDMADARAAWATSRDAKTALHRLPRGAAAERALMAHYAKRGTGPAGHNVAIPALTSIPRTLRMMYVHAYQSYLFNHAASHRVATYGLEAAVEGDLVLIAASPETAMPGVDDHADMPPDDAEPQPAGGQAPAVRHVTAEEAAAKSIPIEDVVLPLPAAGVVYPKHATAEVYTRLAAADGVNLSGGQHNVREFSLSGFSGGYRRVVHRPADLAWRMVRYDDPDAGLTLTPMDEVAGNEGRHKASPSAKTPPVLGPHGGAGDDAVVEGTGRFLALQLAFTLPPSAYATMLTRELLKGSTSITFHKNLSAAQAATAAGAEDGAGAAQADG